MATLGKKILSLKYFVQVTRFSNFHLPSLFFFCPAPFLGILKKLAFGCIWIKMVLMVFQNAPSYIPGYINCPLGYTSNTEITSTPVACSLK